MNNGYCNTGYFKHLTNFGIINVYVYIYHFCNSLSVDVPSTESTVRMARRQNGRVEAKISIGRRDVQRHGAGGGSERSLGIVLHHL